MKVFGMLYCSSAKLSMSMYAEVEEDAELLEPDRNGMAHFCQMLSVLLSAIVYRNKTVTAEGKNCKRKEKLRKSLR
jgi:hypothetical protein